MTLGDDPRRRLYRTGLGSGSIPGGVSGPGFVGSGSTTGGTSGFSRGFGTGSAGVTGGRGFGSSGGLVGSG
jgi:hypothetical protein